MLSDADRARVLDRLAEWANTKLVAPQALQIDADRLGRRRAAEAWTLSHARPMR